MATYTYNFTANGSTGNVVITTEDTPRTYNPGGGATSYTGYRITGISGTFNGQTITALLASNNATSNPLTNDGASNGNAGQYDNVLWTGDNQGNAGASYVGLDNRGVAFTAGGTDYRIYKPSASTNTVAYQSNGTLGQATTYNAANSTPVCFCAGTRILTARGEVAVEDLRVGDMAVTASGQHRPIRWIGHRSLDLRRHPRPETVRPVRIAAHALGPDKPARDLCVSPGHALCLDLLGEVLIPALALVNGATITQVEAESVTYWHVELDSHDLLVAEGQPAESYLDMGNRTFFAESAIVGLAAAPDAEAADRTHADFCRSFHGDDAVAAFARQRLRARAVDLGWDLHREPLGDLHLVVDGHRMEPETDGRVARFVVPASAEDVRLVSHAGMPALVFSESGDRRMLGLALRALTVDDGLATRHTIDLDDERLDEGFHPVETDPALGCSWRWTDGRARLPAALWAGCKGQFFLRVELDVDALPRWVGPRHAADAAEDGTGLSAAA